MAIFENFRRSINEITPAVDGHDSIVWCLNQSGFFNVKDACRWVEDQVFQKDWQVPNPINKLIPPKVGLFVWQAQRNKVATKANLIARGMNLDGQDLCVICNQVHETTEHLFMHCSSVWQLWASIVLREGFSWVIPKSLNSLLVEWEFLPKISDSVLWSLIPYSMIWSVGLERNAACFNNKAANLDQIWEMHVMRIGWWIKSLSTRCPYNLEQFSRDFQNIRLEPQVKKKRNTSWMPPALGVWKVNVDGASRGSPGPSGIGGILKNARNEVKGFFSKNVGRCFAFEAETMAIHEALSLCHQQSIYNIILECDSSIAVGWVNTKKNRPWKIISILNKIDELIPVVNCLEVRHIYREANTEADALAKRGAAYERPLFYLNTTIDA